MKNDESIADFVLPKKLTSFSKLTSLCLTQTNCKQSRHNIIWMPNAVRGTTQSTQSNKNLSDLSKVFLFLVQTFFFSFFCYNSFGKSLVFQGNFVVSVSPKSSRVTDQETCCRQIVCPNIIVFLLASNSINQMFLLRITGAFCPCRLNFCFATETTQKNWNAWRIGRIRMVISNHTKRWKIAFSQ